MKDFDNNVTTFKQRLCRNLTGVVSFLSIFLHLSQSFRLIVPKRVGNRGRFSLQQEVKDNYYPPFFPKSVDELAKDASFSVQLALINRVNRMRVDIRSKLLSRQKFEMEWLLLTARYLITQEFTAIHIFIDRKYDILRCHSLWKDLSATQIENVENLHERIQISYTDEFKVFDSDKLFIIFSPDNIYTAHQSNVVEDCQTLCFHASLHSIPVILINPMLMATSWNDYGPQIPLLLGDFSQVYYICDDYMMLSRRDQWFGLVHRATSGLELFFLQGMLHPAGSRQSSPIKYVRVKSWPQENDQPDDIRSVVVGYILRDPLFRSLVQSKLTKERDQEECAYEDNDLSDVYNALHSLTDSFEAKRSSWKNIKPPPSTVTDIQPR